MSQFTIDVDAEAVFLEGAWYTREDLSRRIRAMLDSGDFNVASPSLALQELTQTMVGIRTLAFRCTPELAEALDQLAGRLGQSVGAVLREAVTQYLTDATSAPPGGPRDQLQESEPLLQARVSSGTTDEAPALAPSSSLADEVQPGGGVEPLELTQMKRAGGPAEPDASSEHRWFKQ
jgi:hypothetical protein